MMEKKDAVHESIKDVHNILHDLHYQSQRIDI